MNRGLRRVVAVLVGAIFVATLASPAEAATSWSRKTSGASGWGSYSRSHQTYTIKYTLHDTKSDGDCAYVLFRPQIQWATKVPGWVSVGTKGYEKRHTVCGWGKSAKGTDRIDVWARMNTVDRHLATKMRMRIKVCRDINNRRDNCSEFVTAAVDL